MAMQVEGMVYRVQVVQYDLHHIPLFKLHDIPAPHITPRRSHCINRGTQTLRVIGEPLQQRRCGGGREADVVQIGIQAWVARLVLAILKADAPHERLGGLYALEAHISNRTVLQEL